VPIVNQTHLAISITIKPEVERKFIHIYIHIHKHTPIHLYTFILCMCIYIQIYIQTCTHTYLHVQTNLPTYIHTYIHAYKHQYNHRCQQINYAYDKITHSDFLFNATFFPIKRTRTSHFFVFQGVKLSFKTNRYILT
jgi:hypothetical protein